MNGAALHGAGRWDEAIAAYEEGLKVEDSEPLRKGLKEVKEAKGTAAMLFQISAAVLDAPTESDSPGLGLGKMFADPNLFGKLAGNPKTAPLLADPAFMQKVCCTFAHLRAWSQWLTRSKLAATDSTEPPSGRFCAARPPHDLGHGRSTWH